MTIHKNGKVSANHNNDELYTTTEVSKMVVDYYKKELLKYDTVLMPFNSKGSNLEKEIKAVHDNVISFDSDFFSEDFSIYSKNSVIFDNPPFSCFGKVLKHTDELGFDFYLFGNAMSMFHHLRKEYVRGVNNIGHDTMFMGSNVGINVSIYTNTNNQIKNTFKLNKNKKIIKLVEGERYPSGKILARVRNGQQFLSEDFIEYSSKEFGGSMIYNPKITQEIVTNDEKTILRY